MIIKKLDKRFLHFKYGFTHQVVFSPGEYKTYDKVYLFLRSQYNANWIIDINYREWDVRYHRPRGEYQIFVKSEAIITMALLS